MIDREEVYRVTNELLSQPRMGRLYSRVKSIYKPLDKTAHNWEHIERVILNSVRVGIPEGADMQIVMAATILHDLGYATNPEDPSQHPVNGAIHSFEYLGEWSEAEQKKISECIRKHKGKYPGFDFYPETLEEMVVCDADQIDKFGWVGFFQMVKVYVEHGTKGIGNFHTLAGLAEGMTHKSHISFYTETGRSIAAEYSEPDQLRIADRFMRELRYYEEWDRPQDAP